MATAPNAPVPTAGRTPSAAAAAIVWLGDTLLRLARILWLCGFATITLVLGAFFFIYNDQGQDLLRMVLEPRPPEPSAASTALFATAILWSLATWYTSRLLLIRRLPGFPLSTDDTAALREWTPRVLGTLAPVILAVSFYRLGAVRELAVYGALAAALLGFYWKRRTWFPGSTGHTDARAHLSSLPRASALIVAVAIALSFLLLLLFVFVPVAPARVLGTPAVFVSGAASILLFGSMILNYVPLSSGYPGLLLPMLLWAVACSVVNDNHRIRTAPVPDPTPSLQKREDPAAHFKHWLAHARQAQSGALAANPSDRYPVFIVAAAGGGIRAAYWTAAILGAAAEQVAKRDAGDARAWRRHLYALSGVSGGSLGAAVHVVELGQSMPADDYVRRATDMLSADHLAPVAAFMLYPDLLQQFVPAPIRPFDRARGLERSWEVSGDRYLAEGVFSAPFLALWKNEPYALPALLLNSTRVETGQRVIVSNLAIPWGPASDTSGEKTQDFLDAVDLIGMTASSPSAPTAAGAGGEVSPTLPRLRPLDTIRLSAAVHLSARFTYVSPAARVERVDGSLWGRLVDGGYFENSGAATAADLIHVICPDWQEDSTCSHSDDELRNVVPVVLLIKNDPRAPSLCDPYTGPTTVPRAPFTEIKSPIDALLATREARGRLAERSIVRLVEAQDKPSGSCDDGCVLEFSLAPPESQSKVRGWPTTTTRYNEPPLGWSLSQSSRREMNQRLSDPDIRQQLQCVTDLAAGEKCTTAIRCP